MSEEEGTQVLLPPRPAGSDPQIWKAYWEAQGQPWRTEPEIDLKRQNYLVERRNIKPDWVQGYYSFKDIKLSRADIEWLLATHENGRGPVDWSDEQQQGRRGLDLRGADLSQQNLRDLPLAGVQGGLAEGEWQESMEEQMGMAAVHMEKAKLEGAQLQGATLLWAHLEGAILWEAQLQGANLMWAHLEGAILSSTQLQGANLRGAHLQAASLNWAQLQGASLREAELDGAILSEPILSDHIHGAVSLVDIIWGEVNLARIDWRPVKRLGDEHWARQRKDLRGFRAAVRANRQLAIVLRNQGLNEEADHFAYRAQLLQRAVLRRQRSILKYLLSWFLSLLAGYGYRPIRSAIWYLVVILGFAIAYAAFGHLPPVPDALIFSLTSFHGRGFFPGLGNDVSLHNPLVVLAAIEAVVGLFIEISFIATFTQRFFGK